jgi:MFS family permease
MGIERVAAAGAVGFLTAFSIVGRLGFGRLGDVLDKRYVFMLGTCLQVAAFIVLLRTTKVAMLYVYSFLVGVNIGGMTPILPGLIVDYFGRRYFGVIYGISHFGVTLGTMMGPFYGGWVFDTTASYSLAFLTSIGLSVAAIAVVYSAGKPLQRESRA